MLAFACCTLRKILTNACSVRLHSLTTMDAEDIKNTDKNFKLETKVGGQMENSVLEKDIIINNHRKLRDNKKETFKNMVDDMKANSGHIVARLQEPSSEKLGTAGLIRKMTVSTTLVSMVAHAW